MNNSQNVSSNSSFVSIRYASLSKELPDANEFAEREVPAIDVETLRKIQRIVEAIRRRIDETEHNGPGTVIGEYPAGDSSGSTTTSSNCRENSEPEKAEKK